MADPTFNLFGPITKNDIKVGYISTDRGYMTGVGVCEANEYAQQNPGTTFIFKPNRKTVKFLNINELNELARNPAEATSDEACPEGLNMNATPEPTKVVFMGGGGIGAVANPVIGDDGAVLAVDLVNGGFGYKYAPLVDIRDDSGIGAGAVVNVEIGEVEEQLIYYSDKDDFEKYEICETGLPKDEFGRRYGPDGKDLGDWTPQSYTNDGSIPFSQVLDAYIKKVQESGKDWWTTRKEPPLQVTSTGQSSKRFYKVTDKTFKELLAKRGIKPPGGGWGKFMNSYAISPVPPSDLKPSDHAGKWYTFEWNIDFPYEGEYIFRGAKDNKARFYLDNEFISELDNYQGALNPIKKSVKKGTKVLRLDVYNQPVREIITVQQPTVASSREVTFKITSNAQFANSIRIEELDIFESKKHKGSEINANITKTIEFGRKYKVVLESAQSTAGVRLRVKDKSILEMEEHTDNDWTDIVCVASAGQFTDLKGNIAYFSVAPPPKVVGRSKGSEGTKTREVFNTIDYITKANRQLWRTNVYARGGFLNDYGVCPFDTKLELTDNPYAGDHTIVWPNVNFPIDGNYNIEVAVDDNVELSIGDQVNLTKNGFTGPDNISTGVLKTTRFIKGGNHNITAKLNQLAGGAFSFKAHDGKKKTKVKFNIAVGGDYGNQITIPGILSIGKQYKGAGSSLSQEREVEIGKEYDVVITTIRQQGGVASSDVRKGAIRFRKTKDGSGGVGNAGPRLEYEDLLGRIGSGSHQDITASVSQGQFYAVDGNKCKFMVGESMKGINPMALAINIETEFTEKEVQRKLSWNENPMGVALTIESPNPPIPQQPVPKSEGRCPNNPFWTTRFPGSTDAWYPVKFDAWGPLMNEYGMSPLPPSDEGDARNDSGSFTNTWKKDFPYGGYYKVVMAADNWGELWIDDQKVMDMGKDSRKSTFTGQREKLIYIDGPNSPDDDPVSHEIKVVVENEKSLKTKLIDAKVFSTLDWIGGGTSKSESKRVNFKITSASLFANSIKIPELGVEASKRYDGPNINQNFVRDVEVNKVYDVELLSTQSQEGVRLRTRGESVLEMEDHTDSSWDDIICGASEGRFFDFKPGANKATCKFVVTAATTVSGGVSGSTTREGVTYEGPHLFHYQDKRWGKIINNEGVSPIGSPTQSLSESNPNIIGVKKMKWKNVDFPKTGDYHITFLADNGASLFIGDKRVLRSKTYEINEYTNDVVKIDKGKHDIMVDLENAPPGGDIFLSNPTGVVLRITTKRRIGTGDYKPWSINPMGVAVKLIPPPCPKKVKGKGKVINPTVIDSGNGYPKPDGPKYPVLLKVKDVVIKDPGINYDCSKDKIRLEPSMGSELELVCGPFGKIQAVKVIKPGLGFTRVPAVIIDTDTGVNLDVAIQFESEIAPFDVPDVIQVTDLVGLKQTGYYRGRPYYGAVFYENGVKYSGWYRTAGELVQVYDTMQESIDAQVTTPPSAILRQGSDTRSNDPRINIPGTPENLI